MGETWSSLGCNQIVPSLTIMFGIAANMDHRQRVCFNPQSRISPDFVLQSRDYGAAGTGAATAT